jgi:uncharacterized damage-inducible protein DinB
MVVMTKFKDSIFHQILKDELATIENGVGDLAIHFEESLKFIQRVPEEMATSAYESGKWTVSEVIGHLLDTRVVFLNRLMYVVRGEQAPLLSFDEQLWINNSGHQKLTIKELAFLYQCGSQLIHATVKTLPDQALSKVGIANHIEITAEEILLYLIAHEKHHFKVIADRYLRH